MVCFATHTHIYLSEWGKVLWICVFFSFFLVIICTDDDDCLYVLDYDPLGKFCPVGSDDDIFEALF